MRLLLLFIFSFIFAEAKCPGADFTSNAPVAAVFLNPWARAQPKLAREIARDIRAAGFATEFIGRDVLTSSSNLLARHFDLLALPDAGALPLSSMNAVRDFARAGGHLIALGLPAWGAATFDFNGKTLSKPDYQRILNGMAADHGIVDFARQDLARWTRSVEGADTKTKIETAEVNGQGALHVMIDNLGGWDTLMSPPLDGAFPDGRTLTCFRARGSKDTLAMAIEWMERDGSRWIATIDLGPEWKSYCLPPEAFHYWPSPGGRGGKGDQLNPRQVARLSFGLARSHSGFSGARLEYWMGNIGSARSPFAGLRSPNLVEAPLLDTISPDWKFYPIHGPATLATPKGLALVSSAGLKSPGDDGALPQAMHPRPRAVGFNQGRTWRWQPLLEARSPQGDYRGAMASLLLHWDDEFRGGIWACFTPASLDFYRQGQVRQLLTQTAKAMRRGLFLQEGGSEFFTAFAGQPFLLGARVINMGKSSQAHLQVRLAVKSKAGLEFGCQKEWSFGLAPGETKTLQKQWQPAQWPEGGFIVTTELLQDGRVIDRLEHELNVWRPKAKPEFIEARDGGFWWRGRPWKANGVNYMPSTGLAVSGGDYFEYWLGQGAYDPEAIERDLERIRAMNLNAVSVFVYHSSMRAQHLLDFLRRCAALGLHVNLSLRPGTPLDFQWAQMKDLIEYFHLAENDTVFAYDLAWEAEHQDEQNSYGRDWTAWVKSRYGSLARAEAAWGQTLGTMAAAGALAVPPLRELAQDGPWRILVADYRAFLDSELTLKYGEARRLIRSIDPRHAVSFRMSEAGDPTLNSDQRLPFDFYGLAPAVDIWEPEAYGRIGDWNWTRIGRFEVDYARLCDPNKPVIWAEMGYNAWDERPGMAPPEKLEFAGAFCRDFYRMMTEAGCDGVFFWWYPGGYRFNERSDFGIINPDGTDRPETKVIRAEGPAFLQSAKPPPGHDLIGVDRDRDARGLFGIYQAVKKEYWQAIAEGKVPALQWDKEPGK